MMDLPMAFRAGLCILQLVLVLALARFPLERAGGHDGLRLARDAAVGVSLLPVPVLGPALGAATLIALVILRTRADDGARAALSRLASSALLPGRTAWWGRDDKASDRRVRSTLSARPPVQSLPERPKATGLASSPPPPQGPMAGGRPVRHPRTRLRHLRSPACCPGARPPESLRESRLSAEPLRPSGGISARSRHRLARSAPAPVRQTDARGSSLTGSSVTVPTTATPSAPPRPSSSTPSPPASSPSCPADELPGLPRPPRPPVSSCCAPGRAACDASSTAKENCLEPHRQPS